MIVCKICGYTAKNCIRVHIKSVHGINAARYKEMYPGESTKSIEYRNKLSEGTIKDFAKLSKAERSGRAYKRTDDHRKNFRKLMVDKRSKKTHDELYSKERNEKISIGKTKWWSTVDKSTRSEWWKQNTKKFRSRIGEDAYLSKMVQKSILGYKAVCGIEGSSLERKIKDKLKNEGISYVEQYPLGGYSYDFYIPQYNLLIEADGVFFHPLKKSECKYEWQEKNMERANRKNILAKDMGYNLIRIREDEVPDNIALHISSHLMEIV